MPTISRRLASAGIADPGDLKSPSLPGASPGSPTGVWLTGKSRPVRLKIEQPWECKSPHADHFGMSTGRAGRTCLLNSGLLARGVWCESTAFRQDLAIRKILRIELLRSLGFQSCRRRTVQVFHRGDGQAASKFLRAVDRRGMPE